MKTTLNEIWCAAETKYGDYYTPTLIDREAILTGLNKTSPDDDTLWLDEILDMNITGLFEIAMFSLWAVDRNKYRKDMIHLGLDYIDTIIQNVDSKKFERVPKLIRGYVLEPSDGNYGHEDSTSSFYKTIPSRYEARCKALRDSIRSDDGLCVDYSDAWGEWQDRDGFPLSHARVAIIEAIIGYVDTSRLPLCVLQISSRCLLSAKRAAEDNYRIINREYCKAHPGQPWLKSGDEAWDDQKQKMATIFKRVVSSCRARETNISEI
jgi:hypothetical protein